MKISRTRHIYPLLGAALALGLIALCYLRGDAVTPRDAQGRPLLYSPGVRAAVQYQHALRSWTAEMAALDAQLTVVLGSGDLGDPARLYEVGSAVERLAAQATELAREVVFAIPPPALAGLHDQARQAALAVMDAADLTARWVGAPDEATYRSAVSALGLARSLRVQLEQSRWVSHD